MGLGSKSIPNDASNPDALGSLSGRQGLAFCHHVITPALSCSFMGEQWLLNHLGRHVGDFAMRKKRDVQESVHVSGLHEPEECHCEHFEERAEDKWNKLKKGVRAI